MKKRAITASLIATAVPAKTDAHPREVSPGCLTHTCAKRVWRKHHHPRAHAASITAPYRAWLNRVAWCESSNNTRAISPNGLYRGLFQFDLQTWASVGGTGDPIDASRGEQELRAVLLLKQRGTSPWPVCG